MAEEPVRRAMEGGTMGAAQVAVRTTGGATASEPSGVSLDDGDLVAKHLDGDRRAFGALYERHHPRLLAYCRRGTKTAQSAEDVAHDVMVRALTYLDRFDRDRPLWPWLKQIAANELADHYRESDHVVDVSDDALPDPEPATDEHTVWLAERDVLTKAMGDLSPRDRTVLTLKYCGDWDSDELQALFNIERPALYKLLQRARERLHNAYQELADSKLGGFVVAPLLERIRLWTAKTRAQLSGWDSGLLGSSGVSADCLVRAAAALAVGLGLGATVAIAAPDDGTASAASVTAPADLPALISLTSQVGSEDVVTPSTRSHVGIDGHVEEGGGDATAASTRSHRHLGADVSVPASDDSAAPTAQAVAQTGEDSDENRTLNSRIESRTGDQNIVTRNTATTIYCDRSAIAAAACDAYDAADRVLPEIP